MKTLIDGESSEHLLNCIVECCRKTISEIISLLSDITNSRLVSWETWAQHTTRLGQVEKAIQYYEKALAISQEIGDRRGEGTRLGNLGLAYCSLGQVEKAIKYYEQALNISKEIGDGNEGVWLGNLGSAYRDLGSF